MAGKATGGATTRDRPLRERPLPVIVGATLTVVVLLAIAAVVIRHSVVADAAPPAPGWGSDSGIGPGRAAVNTATPRDFATQGPTTQGTPQPSPPQQPATPAPPGPSGVAMPRGDLPGWRQVLADDFTGTDTGAGWGYYNGPISSTPGGMWSPSHVRVSGGLLRVLGYRDGGSFVTGGLMNHGPAQTTYGKYEVRFRADKGNGVKYAILLWPASGRWPDDGEIDFAEDGGGGRQGFSATLHYPVDGQDAQTQKDVEGDFSVWHTVGVEWSADKLVYTLDGKAWATVTTKRTPSVPMNLVIQTEAAATCTQWVSCLDATTPANVNVEVDWVTAYVRL